MKIINKWTLIYGRCSLKWFWNPVNVSLVFLLRSIQKLIAWWLVAWQQASCIFIVALSAVINIQTQWHTLSVSKLSCQGLKTLSLLCTRLRKWPIQDFWSLLTSFLRCLLTILILVLNSEVYGFKFEPRTSCLFKVERCATDQ